MDLSLLDFWCGSLPWYDFQKCSTWPSALIALPSVSINIWAARNVDIPSSRQRSRQEQKDNGKQCQDAGKSKHMTDLLQMFQEIASCSPSLPHFNIRNWRWPWFIIDTPKSKPRVNLTEQLRKNNKQLMFHRHFPCLEIVMLRHAQSLLVHKQKILCW